MDLLPSLHEKGIHISFAQSLSALNLVLRLKMFLFDDCGPSQMQCTSKLYIIFELG